MSATLVGQVAADAELGSALLALDRSSAARRHLRLELELDAASDCSRNVHERLLAQLDTDESVCQRTRAAYLLQHRWRTRREAPPLVVMAEPVSDVASEGGADGGSSVGDGDGDGGSADGCGGGCGASSGGGASACGTHEALEARLRARIEAFGERPARLCRPSLDSGTAGGEEQPRPAGAEHGRQQGRQEEAEQAAARTRGQRLAALQRWCVVGDTASRGAQVGHLAKQADAIAAGLRAAGRTVHRVNPRDASGALPASLRELDATVDVLNLTVNPRDGLAALRDAVALGIRRVYVTPGASSIEIVSFCLEHGLEVHQGCILTHQLAPIPRA